MATGFSEIITKHAMNFIEDVNWTEQLQENPAQFFRAKSLILLNSIPRFNRPYNIREFLQDYTEPTYADMYVTADTTATSITVETDCTGYELCNTGIVEQANGTITYTPCITHYFPETGVVVVEAREGQIKQGQQIEIDFYTDGYFNNDLTPTQKRILGLCMAVDWYYSFANTFLNVANLITDKTFNLRSPSEHIRVNTERYRNLESKLSSELMAYEQSCFAVQTVAKTTFPQFQ